MLWHKHNSNEYARNRGNGVGGWERRGEVKVKHKHVTKMLILDETNIKSAAKE